MEHKPDVKPVILTTRAARAEPMPTEIAREYHIVIADSLPRSHGDPYFNSRHIQQRCDVDAFHIAQALRGSLPGGTFDRLVVELLRMTQCDRTIRLPPVSR